MNEDAVTDLLDAFSRRQIRVWVAGGWAVDAVVGRQTRTHGDLDVAVDADQLAGLLSLLGELGFSITVDQLPCRAELSASDGRRVDLHPVQFAADGSGRQAGLAGSFFAYAADGFSTGVIAGHVVSCLSVQQQLRFRQGYELRPVDHHDLELLHTARDGRGQDVAVTDPLQLHDPDRRGFASDNNSGVHPDVLAAIAAANGGHQLAYGADVYTTRLGQVMADHFGDGVQAFPVFNGTGANVAGLQSMLPRWGAVVCAATAHINTDENAAPERVGGLKLLTVEASDGKLTPDLIDEQAWGWGDEHRAQPLAVSITQATELGTTYTADEVRAIADHVHALGMRLHMDGARLANAAASLGVPLRALTRDAGVDVLSFGGTKNGLLFGECIVVLDRGSSEGLHYLRKLTMQLASKMRFISAQFVALLTDDLWLRNAAQANAMATRLRSSLASAVDAGTSTDVSFTQPTQTNAVFAVLPSEVARRVREEFPFYDWNQSTGEVRWMCSYDTTETDVDRFVACLVRELAPDRDLA